MIDLGDPPDEALLEARPYSYPMAHRHYSQILLRDFDLSPNFQVVKFNIIEEGDFDYKHLTWTTPGPEACHLAPISATPAPVGMLNRQIAKA